MSVGAAASIKHLIATLIYARTISIEQTHDIYGMRVRGFIRAHGLGDQKIVPDSGGVIRNIGQLHHPGDGVIYYPFAVHIRFQINSVSGQVRQKLNNQICDAAHQQVLSHCSRRISP